MKSQTSRAANQAAQAFIPNNSEQKGFAAMRGGSQTDNGLIEKKPIDSGPPMRSDKSGCFFQSIILLEDLGQKPGVSENSEHNSEQIALTR